MQIESQIAKTILEDTDSALSSFVYSESLPIETWEKLRRDIDAVIKKAFDDTYPDITAKQEQPAISLDNLIGSFEHPSEFQGDHYWAKEVIDELHNLEALLTSFDRRLKSLERRASANERPA